MAGKYDDQNRYHKKKAAEVADIGPIPLIVNLKRRLECRLDLEKFLSIYFPASTGLRPFSKDHKDAIQRIQTAVLEGGRFGQIMPRGGAKTTIGENATIWVLVYGHRRFPTLFGADATAAEGNIASIKMELSENDLLLEDFPEVCFPIRALEGKSQRCLSQSYKPGNFDGHESTAETKQTHVAWRSDTIIIPQVDVPDGWGKTEELNFESLSESPASGTILTCRGIMAGSRGLKHKRPDGTQQRPDFIILDDPQTDSSSATPLQVDKALRVIRKNILKLGGHDRKTAVVMNATVIKKDDLVERMMNQKDFPDWQFIRVKMVKKWSAVHDTLWMQDYSRLRCTYDPTILGDQQRAHRQATDFYKANRAAMDDQCETFWESCFDEALELSAIQHAYNLLIDDGPEVFASECQNEPLEDRAFEGKQETLSANEIANKLNRLARGVVPLEASRVVAHIDVQQRLLYWKAAAFGDGFTGGILDYGTWPDQHRPYFSYKEARNTIARSTKQKMLEGQIYAALDALVNDLAGREWKREDGAILRIEKILVDCGYMTDTIRNFCRRSPHANILLPAKGIGRRAKDRPLNEGMPKPGERHGWGWKIPADPIKTILIDTNSWKTRMHGLLAVPAGAKGCLSLFGTEAETHRLVADHITSEFPVEVAANGRTVWEWQMKPGRPDNHYFDNLIGCGVAASFLGVEINGKDPKKIKRVRSLAEMQKKARHHGIKP